MEQLLLTNILTANYSKIVFKLYLNTNTENSIKYFYFILFTNIFF